MNESVTQEATELQCQPPGKSLCCRIVAAAYSAGCPGGAVASAKPRNVVRHVIWKGRSGFVGVTHLQSLASSSLSFSLKDFEAFDRSTGKNSKEQLMME
jgi:hypothetical protein